MGSQERDVLITVKAYPNPSKKYGETVCCAGVDINTGQWLRLYPIPFRDLDDSQKFRKYTIIRVRCTKASDDHRIESHKIDSDSIQVLQHFDTSDRWKRRKKIVLPVLSESFCEILAGIDQGRSLGLFKPENVDFFWKKASKDDEDRRKACYTQLTFFDKTKEPIEKIPYDFYYTFKCEGVPKCPGHKLPVTDWELGQSYRGWRSRYPKEEERVEKIKQKWLTNMCASKNDVCFYVGNMQRFPGQFMVLGVFYPPK